ncbi:MAG TPA: GAF and ANTAR domain-containing protein [Nocardioides sp.]|uniref:GAF and ANTAR domain-containing protein n=1 Tax=Nocardioides sp. TaxID=35761 RepID=UPI002F42F64F
MSDRYEFNRSLAEAARAMSEERGTQATLDRAVQMATDMLEHCDFAGISIVGPTGIDTPAATDEALRLIDELQYEMEEGPCRDALKQTDVLVVNNLAEDPRWPNWGPHIARELDVHSSMSIRLFTSDQNMGALNCYAMKTDAFKSEDVLDGLIVAAHAAVALAGTLEEDHLRRALETRRMIGEATGILRERFGLTTDQAFGVLRRMSQTHNIKLHQVAQTLVDTGVLPDAHLNQRGPSQVPSP